ncbi:MAG: hypothetical protein JXB45_04775 [Candidatus Krumholzibacteriota bacterium]|nr:hypothetical protein [Candidatus Krumholzibacteriota bacterium]
MDSFELREEIKWVGGSYFLQTSYLPNEKQVRSAFFKDGNIFDTVLQELEDEPSPAALRELTKEIHNHNRKKFQFLLDAGKKIKDMDDPVPHLKLAQAMARRNLHAEAIREAEKAIEKGIDDSRAYMVLGSSWYKLKDYKHAFEAIRKGIEISSDYPDLHNMMGQIYLKQNMCRMAVESFKRAIGLNLYFAQPYLNLVKAYILNTVIKQDYELSKNLSEKFNANVERSVQLNPFLDTESIRRARELFNEERLEEALAELNKIGEKSGRQVVDDVILELYLILLQSGKELPETEIEKYLVKIQEIIDQNPTFADAYNSLGILYTAKCKIFMDRAGEAFGKALEINNDYSKAKKNQRLTENDREGIFILLKALLD